MGTVFRSTILFLPKRKVQKDSFQINNFSFTNREIDILSCLLSGRSSKSIGLILNLSSKTVETHVRNILQKTSTHSKEEIINLIEGSTTYNAFKSHYLNTLRPHDKDRVIKALHSSFKEKKILVKIIGLNAQTKDLIQQFKTDYARLGWEVRVHGIPEGKKIESGPKPYDDSLSLKIEKIENEENLYTIQIEIEKENKALDTKPEGSSYLPYEVAFLRGVQSICHKDDINNSISPFMQKHGPLKIQTEKALSLSSSKKPLFGYITKHKHIVFAVCLLILTIVGSYFAFAQTKEKISNLYLIPKEKLLFRQQEINKLDTIFKNHSDKETNPIVAIVGIGGAGKTTLARTYANQSNSSLVWELNATNVETLLSSLEELGSKLSNKNETLKKEYENILKNIDQKEKVIHILYFIRKHLRTYKDWILIYDDLKIDYGFIDEYLFRNREFSGNGKVIITTRNANVKFGVKYGNILLLENLTDQEKICLFNKINPPKKIKNKDIEKLPSFPLDVSMASHYMLENNISMNEYIERVTSSDKEVQELQENILNNVGKYNHTREKIINTSMNC